MGSHTIVRRRREDAAERVDTDIRATLDAFRHVVRVLRVYSRTAEKRVGLSAAQLFVLQRLGEAPALSVGDLAARTFTHQSSVSVVVRRLRERTLVRGATARDDRRRIELTLTPAGRALLRRAPHVAQERLIAALRGLRRGDRRDLARTLTRVARLMGGSGAPTMFFEERDGRARH